MNIPKPVKPKMEPIEDIATIPDQRCVWGPEDEDSDCWHGIHDYRECLNCGESSPECSHEVTIEEQVSVDCLRNQAEDRNRKREREFVKAMDRWDAQMDYYAELVRIGVASTE